MALLLLVLQDPLIDVHRFGPADPSWTLRELRLRLPLGPDDQPKDRGDGMIEFRPDGLIRVEAGEHAPVVWTERSWFDGRRVVRRFLYDGAMRLRVEFDDAGDEYFTRYRRPDGSTAAYTRVHAKDFRFIEGFSDEGGARRFVAGGNGELIVPGLRSGDREEYWIHGGRAIVWAEIRQGRRERVSLNLGDACLDRRPKSEFLSMDDEFWSKDDGGQPSYQLSKYFMSVDGRMCAKDVKPKPDVREMPMYGSTMGVVEEWAIAYPKRRAAFVARVEALLSKAGRTWESLGIGFIRDGAGWPR